MKLLKSLLILFVFTISFSSKSQSRIGYTFKEVYDEFSPDFEYKTGTSQEFGNYMVFFTERSSVYYYFNSKGICHIVILLPKNSADLHFFIEHYNRSYVITSDKSWKVYTDGSSLNIDLLWAEDGGYFFLFYTNQ